jgi:hypothetical protein
MSTPLKLDRAPRLGALHEERYMEGTAQVGYKVPSGSQTVSKPPTNFESLSNEMCEIHVKADTTLRRLRSLLARAHGPAPETKPEGLKEVPCGVIGEMRSHISNTFDRFNEIDSALEVIEAII